MTTSEADIIANRGQIITIPTIVDITIPTDITTITNEHLNIMMTPTDIHLIRRSDIESHNTKILSFITATLGQNGLFIGLKGPHEVIATTRILSEVTATTHMTPLMVASLRLCHMAPRLMDIPSQGMRLMDSLLRHLTLSQATLVILVIKQLLKTQFFYKQNSYTDSFPPSSFPPFLSPIPLFFSFHGNKNNFLLKNTAF